MDSKPQVSLRDVAAQLGVSHTTVSLALKGNPRISGKRVEKTAREMGFQPEVGHLFLGAGRGPGPPRHNPRYDGGIQLDPFGRPRWPAPLNRTRLPSIAFLLVIACTFSWEKVPGADSYHVKRTTPDNGPDLIIDNVSTTSLGSHYDVCSRVREYRDSQPFPTDLPSAPEKKATHLPQC